jgi:glycerate-2-kinase
VPTFKELGVDWVDGAYRGIGVPRSTPPEARKRWPTCGRRLNNDAEMKELAFKSGFELVNVGPEQMDAFMRDKTKVYTERTLVLGAGKAGGSMAQALEALWPADAPLSGLVVTRYGHMCRPGQTGWCSALKWSRPRTPCPTRQAWQAAERMLALTQGLTADDLVLCLISGGGSALLTLPADGLTLADKQRINRALLASGAALAR